MADIGKITVYYRKVTVECLDQDVEIIEETPEGIKVRHTYRKTGKRLEFIPRDKLEGIVYEDIKTPRNPRKAKEATPIPKPVKPVEEKPVVPVVDTSDDGIFSENEDFDDSGDDFDDEFE